MADIADYSQLERIGNELSDRSLAGTLDFVAFERLFAEARAACGPDTDALEIFCPFAKPDVLVGLDGQRTPETSVPPRVPLGCIAAVLRALMGRNNAGQCPKDALIAAGPPTRGAHYHPCDGAGRAPR